MEAFILLIYDILVSNGLFSLLGQHIMTEEKLHVSNYRQLTNKLRAWNKGSIWKKMIEIIGFHVLNSVFSNLSYFFECINMTWG